MKKSRVILFAALLSFYLASLAPTPEYASAQERPQVQVQSSPPNYKTTFVALANGVPGLLYEPLTPGPKAEIVVLTMHGNADYLTGYGSPCPQIAQRGYRVLCANTSTSKSGFFSDDNEDAILLNIKAGVVYLRKYPAVRKIVLYGHSGGGATMASYQNIAENGLKACQGPEKLIKCSDSLAGMPPADGVMMIDSTWGEASSLLFSLDPSVIDENNPERRDPALDMYNPKNGYDSKGSTYSDSFKSLFFAKTRDRMNALIAKAQDRLQKIQSGQGHYTDDEPFLIPGSRSYANKLHSEDLSLWAHTQDAWPLLHPDGTTTTEIIHSVRVPRSGTSPTSSLANGTVNTTVRNFLNTFAIRVNPDFGYDASSIHGVDYRSSYANAINGVEGFTEPLLQMGMTGSYEFFLAETVHGHAKSSDKTLVYVDGAVHGLSPCTKCATAKGLPANYYGDTTKTVFDFIDSWLSKPGRF